MCLRVAEAVEDPIRMCRGAGWRSWIHWGISSHWSDVFLLSVHLTWLSCLGMGGIRHRLSPPSSSPLLGTSAKVCVSPK